MFNELPLSDEDRSNLKNYISLATIIGGMFVVGLVILFGVVIFGISFFTKSSAGFWNRLVLILAGLSLPFIVVMWSNVLIWIDLKKGFKKQITTYSYRIEVSKKRLFLDDVEAGVKIDVDENILELIDTKKPLTIELTPVSKTLLFISHNQQNLLTND